MIFNHSAEDCKLNAGDPIASVFFHPVIDIEVVEMSDKLESDSLNADNEL
jgi:dUTPase